MEYIQNLLTQVAAENIADKISGIPSEDRILIAVPKDDAKTKSGLIIPGTAKDELPRKGVVLRKGRISEDNFTGKSLEVGDVITFGLYAGKEVFPINSPKLESQSLMVLSITEIIYIENNTL